MKRDEALQVVYHARIGALSKLTRLALKLNGDWRPDWLDEDQIKYYIATDFHEITVHKRKRFAPAGTVFFKSEEDALQAISEIDTELLFDNIDTFIKEVGWDDEYAIVPTSRQMLDEAQELMKSKGFVTTLDFKQALRAKNLYMTQADASTSLANISVDLNWQRELNPSSRYLIYTE